MLQSLPSTVQAVLRQFRTCEFTTLTRRGEPVSWPLAAHALFDQDCILLTTSISMAQKAANIRRDPRVALLYSNPTASGLIDPPAVLVQGLAEVNDAPVTALDAVPGLREYWRDAIFARQPASALMSNNWPARLLTDWYFMRLVIRVHPLQWRSWPGAAEPAAAAPNLGGAAGDLPALLARFSSAALTGLDEHGWPFSLRCQPRPNPNSSPSGELLLPDLPAGLPLQPGPANLLCHAHDAGMWNFKSFQVRGRLEYRQESWRFCPERLLPGAGFGGLLGYAQMLLSARAAAAYLRQRGLPRPRIPWGQIHSLRAEARQPSLRPQA